MTNAVSTLITRMQKVLAYPRVARVLTIFTSAFCLLAAAALLRSAWSAFTWGKFDLFDYGIYTNMIWNSGRGQLFRFLMDQSYLRIHLSFTLALLGPLFRVWDHPFLLSFLQWLMLVGGSVMICLAGRRHGLPATAIAAMVLLYLAYPFTQTVILCEFHGVGLYLLLLPWLYYCLSLDKCEWAWLPLALTLGVREDAFLALLPMLAYFAVKRRSRMIGAMLAAAVLYALISLFWLYPLINGKSLFAVRAGYMPRSTFAAIFTGKALTRRLRALLCVLIPTVFLLRRGWVPMLCFVSLPLVAALAASSRFQYELKMHYPAAVMVCLALGVLEALTLAHRKSREDAPAAVHLHAAYLVAVALAMHLWRGYLPLGGRHKAEYAGPKGSARAKLDAAAHIPKEGVLVCDNRLTVFCANRSDIDVWKPRYTLPAHRQYEPDVALLKFSDLRGRKADTFLPLLTNGLYGVIYTNESYLVLQRGAPTVLHNTAPFATVPAGDTNGPSPRSNPTRNR